MYKIKILVADDHDLVREGIVSILKTCEDFEVVAEASDGLEAIKKVSESKPDIILMDINMPKLGGYEATLEIKKSDNKIKIIILTQYDDKEYVSKFLKAGVSGYVLKKAAGVDLITAIKAAYKGDIYLHPSIVPDVVSTFIDGKKLTNIEDPYEKLTDREKQILKLIAEGYMHKEIADILNISVKTVVAHQSNISEKLNIHTKFGLIKYAIQKGIVKIDT
jgi:DNA-binding NarL/FixJ family response regulator